MRGYSAARGFPNLDGRKAMLQLTCMSISEKVLGIWDMSHASSVRASADLRVFATVM
jgi:hypothetical protein